jgi:hypothetical protein
VCVCVCVCARCVCVSVCVVCALCACSRVCVLPPFAADSARRQIKLSDCTRTQTRMHITKTTRIAGKFGQTPFTLSLLSRWTEALLSHFS